MYETPTSPDPVSPWESTDVDPVRLRAQIQALSRRKVNRQPRRPELYWEEAGVHGAGRAVDLRRWPTPPQGVSGARPPVVAGLPTRPSYSFLSDIKVEHVVIAGAAIGASYLVHRWWKNRKKK